MRTLEEDEGGFEGEEGFFDGGCSLQIEEEGGEPWKKKLEANEEEGGSRGFLIVITFSGDISN